jgi:hypothetical protein
MLICLRLFICGGMKIVVEQIFKKKENAAGKIANNHFPSIPFNWQT